MEEMKLPVLELYQVLLHLYEVRKTIAAELANSGTAKKDAITFTRSQHRSLKSRFGLYESHDVYCPAIFCDPRFKSALLNASLASLTPSKEVQSPNRSQTEVSAVEMKPSTGFGLWPALIRFQMNHHEKLMRITRDRNSYMWWNEEGKQKYPKLSKVAMEYLGIPATSVANVRVFSSFGNVVTVRRQSLTARHVQRITFLQ
ncbi:hypothetical protein PR048_007113 [Dryococelus australis]|uniref:HAT C-terminal dimerisation domain-containing protein n=1 Tax=Dryococelus australis TaxID=614101 RepID=A0ABQ9IDY0_9NEOP|nr:hypothetical protein PR048_007113 [Dryococelus australis]